jgi:hypothetical protein
VLLLRACCGYSTKEHEKWKRRFVVTIDNGVQKQQQRKLEVSEGEVMRLADSIRKREL